MKIPFHIKMAIGLIALLIVISGVSSLYQGFTQFYNSTTKVHFEYNRLVENQITTFDNNYLIFKEKSSIAGLNKETFVEVTKIIFDARTDGENVAWKWVHENQQVDYREFSKFYSDLSEFAKERFKSNSSIEAQKQEMVKFHNLSISTFPGIIYNYFLKIKPLVYTNGFVTQETAALFAKPK